MLEIIAFWISFYLTSLAANISPRLPIIMAGVFMGAAGGWLAIHRLQSEKS